MERENAQKELGKEYFPAPSLCLFFKCLRVIQKSLLYNSIKGSTNRDLPHQGFKFLSPGLPYLACCVLPHGYKTSIRHRIQQDHPTQSKTKHEKLTRLPPQKESVPALCPSVAAPSLLYLVIWALAAHRYPQPSVFTVSFILGLRVAEIRSLIWKAFPQPSD